jgi:hypothetical protein
MEFGMGILQDRAAQVPLVVGFCQVMEAKKGSHGLDCILHG